MCKCVLDVIQSLHKQLFKQKPSATLSGNIREVIFDQICYVLPYLRDYQPILRKNIPNNVCR